MVLRDNLARLVTYSFSVDARTVPSCYEAAELCPFTLENDQCTRSQGNYSSDQSGRQHLSLGSKSDSKFSMTEIDESSGKAKKADTRGR